MIFSKTFPLRQAVILVLWVAWAALRNALTFSTTFFLRQAVVLVLWVAGAAWAGPEDYGSGGSGGQGGQSPSAPAKYLFQWAVNDSPSGNSYGHSEQREGDVTQGK